MAHDSDGGRVAEPHGETAEDALAEEEFIVAGAQAGEHEGDYEEQTGRIEDDLVEVRVGPVKKQESIKRLSNCDSLSRSNPGFLAITRASKSTCRYEIMLEIEHTCGPHRSQIGPLIKPPENCAKIWIDPIHATSEGLRALRNVSR